MTARAIKRTRRATSKSSSRAKGDKALELLARARERSTARAKRLDVLRSINAAALVRIAGPLT